MPGGEDFPVPTDCAQAAVLTGSCISAGLLEAELWIVVVVRALSRMDKSDSE